VGGQLPLNLHRFRLSGTKEVEPNAGQIGHLDGEAMMRFSPKARFRKAQALCYYSRFGLDKQIHIANGSDKEEVSGETPFPLWGVRTENSQTPDAPPSLDGDAVFRPRLRLGIGETQCLVPIRGEKDKRGRLPYGVIVALVKHSKGPLLRSGRNIDEEVQSACCPCAVHEKAVGGLTNPLCPCCRKENRKEENDEPARHESHLLRKWSFAILTSLKGSKAAPNLCCARTRTGGLWEGCGLRHRGWQSWCRFAG